jgi:hypothetical protein
MSATPLRLRRWPAWSWRASASLFDVSNPAAPTLLDREDVGDSSATAVWYRKAFGVFPGRILVPRWDGLAVVERASTSLTLRGLIDVAGGALRGFPRGNAIVAAGAEEVVMADAATLNPIGRVTIAENVVDIDRLGNGTLLRLVQAGKRARLGGAEVELWAEAFYPYGQSAAIVGWDATGRAVRPCWRWGCVHRARLLRRTGGADLLGQVGAARPPRR